MDVKVEVLPEITERLRSDRLADIDERILDSFIEPDAHRDANFDLSTNYEKSNEVASESINGQYLSPISFSGTLI